jgi:hypothetical protein
LGARERVIKSGFLEAQSAKSLAQKKTTPFLRRLIASTIDRAAQEHYGAAYPMKCVQTSHAVVRLLDQFKIGGRLCEGGLCAAMVHEDSRFDGWGGFWDGNHHVWAMTRFGELVDLSISQMHRHARAGRSDALAVPAMWWDDKSAALPVIRYLPDNFFMNVAFSDETAAADLESFENRVQQILEEKLERQDVHQVVFGALLENMDGARSLHKRGHPWLTRAIAFHNRKAPLPRWVAEREARLISEAGSSRL